MKKSECTTKYKQNAKSLSIWSFIWVVTMAIAAFGPMQLWGGNKIISLIAVLVNLLIGAKMIMANIKHVNEMDELQKKIQLDAMGIALGVGIVGGLTYALLSITNLISHKADIAFLVMLIGFTYMIGVRIGQNRFK
jgi:hypothetical protein